VSHEKLYNLDLEKSVLGGILLSHQYREREVLARLDLETVDFFSPKHQAVFQAMRNVESREDPIAVETLGVELRRLNRLDAIGGLAFLGELSLCVTSPANTEHYARELVSYRAKRDMARALSEALEVLQSTEDVTAVDAMSEVMKRLAGVRLGVNDPTVPVADIMLEEWQAIERDLVAIDDGTHVGGMPTGLEKLDALTGGLPRGSVTLVLGETGHGKSTLAMSFARASADLTGDQPLVFSYEDSRRRYGQRALAQDSGVPTQVIRRRSFRPGELRQLGTALERLGLRRERVAKMRGKDVGELCMLVRRLRAKGPEVSRKSIGNLVVVDYLQAMPFPRAPHIRSVPEALGEIAKRLEDLADDLDIALALFSQVNDEPHNGNNGDHRPSLRDGAGGRDAAKGAKLVLGIYRPWLYDSAADPYAGEILVLKNNDGEMRKKADVYLDLATHTIRDCAPDAQSQQNQQAALELPEPPEVNHHGH
jgi:replicative DNA helicase